MGNPEREMRAFIATLLGLVCVDAWHTDVRPVHHVNAMRVSPPRMQIALRPINGHTLQVHTTFTSDSAEDERMVSAPVLPKKGACGTYTECTCGKKKGGRTPDPRMAVTDDTDDMLPDWEYQHLLASASFLKQVI